MRISRKQRQHGIALQAGDAAAGGVDRGAERRVVHGPMAQRRVVAQVVQAQGERVKALLYFNCVGRGQELYLEPDVDLRALTSALPGVPVLGMGASFELGPRSGRTWLHMYSGVLVALLGSS